MFARGIIVLLCVLVAISDGEREPNCKDDSDGCSMEYSPLCGSDDITYANECTLCGAMKESGDEIFILNEGRCDPENEDLEEE